MICWELAPNLRRTNNNNHSKTVCSFTTNQRSNQPTTTNIITCQGSEIQFSTITCSQVHPKQNKLKHKKNPHTSLSQKNITITTFFLFHRNGTFWFASHLRLCDERFSPIKSYRKNCYDIWVFPSMVGFPPFHTPSFDHF